MRHPPDVSIAAATPDDVEAIADIVRRSYSSLPDSQIPADMPIYHPSYHAEAMRDTSTRWRLLRDHDGPAGMAMWRMLDELAHMHLLFVSCDRQGQGYGSHLLRHFRDCALSEDPSIRLLTLHCLAGSTRSLRFYRHHGYTAYEPGMEGYIPDLYLWIDAARREDSAWPLKKDKVLFFKLIR